MTSLYDFVVPSYTHALDVLEHILQKGEAYCKTSNISEQDILAWRVAPDMLPFPKQVQLVCNGAKLALSRVADITLPVIDDNETTLAELHARIATTRAMFDGVKREQFKDREQTEIVFGREGAHRYNGLEYVRSWALPNLYFHLTTIYLLFRGHGAPVGKMDFLKGPQVEA